LAPPKNLALNNRHFLGEPRCKKGWVHLNTR
jgi:hypothetical protein